MKNAIKKIKIIELDNDLEAVRTKTIIKLFGIVLYVGTKKLPTVI